jgi:CBS domain-containing protein
MATVKDILRGKGNVVWTIDADTYVAEALKQMAEKEVGGLIVTEGGTPVGFFSEREYARRVFLEHKTSDTTRVRELMRTNLNPVPPEEEITKCMETMTRERVRYLPVIQGGQLLGLVSIGDLVKYVISEQEETIRSLQNYIAGGA